MPPITPDLFTEVREEERKKNSIVLRDYQKQSLEKMLWVMGRSLEGNDLIVLPTGAGKSIVISALASAMPDPILILQPSKEILEQNLAKLQLYVDRSEIGVYSASMNEKTIGHYTFATIQSIYTKPEFFKHFKLVIIDEAHLVNPKNLTGMFTSFLKAIGNPKVVGLTATPYRMDTAYTRDEYGGITAHATIKLINRMKGFFWKRILFNINMEELIQSGYLCSLEYIDRSVVEHQQLQLNKSRTDFDMESLEGVLSQKQNQILAAISYGMETSKSVLVFNSSVAQANKFSSMVPDSAAVSAKTPKKERDRIIREFKEGKIKAVFNVGVLTTGFDHPALDCIILIRPTRSIALYYQMLGRGVRIAPGKTSCKVIDLTSTVKSMGRVETIKLVKRDKWELESETSPNWHGAHLYSYSLKI